MSSASDEEAGFNYTNNRLMYEERKPDFIARQHDIRLAFLSGCTHVRNSLSANNKEKETGGYLESEKQFQIIALRALGLDYEKLGCTFEQSINGVIHMAVSAKQELKEKDELLKQAALSLQGMIILWQQLSKVLLPVADELAYKKAIEVYEIVTSNQ